MPDSEKKRDWMQKHSLTIAVKIMKKADQPLIDYILGKTEPDGITRSELIKTALKEYMANHPLTEREESNNDQDPDRKHQEELHP